MRVDLHCHTKSTKKGDGAGRNVTVELFKQKIADADVKIVAITNHNAFDFTQYNELKNAVVGFCQVWPGVEIDVQGEENKYHLIVVANPENVEMFSTRVENLFKDKNIETCTIYLNDVYNTLNECDVIYITHYCKKPSISEGEFDQLAELVGDNSRVFGEPQNYKSLGIFANHDYNVIIGSDVKDWSKYEKSTFAELKLPVESFKQFCLLSKKDKTVVETLLNKKQSFNLIAKPHDSVSLSCTIYKDINIVFGQKGTGKSEILKSMYDNLVSQGIDCSLYNASEKESSFKSLLNNLDMPTDVTKVGSKKCDKEFSIIAEWSDYNPTPITKYVEWYKTKDNNTNKKKMRITDSTTLTESNPENYSLHRNDYHSILEIEKNYEHLDINRYLDDEDSEYLIQLMEKLKSNIKKTYQDDEIDILSTRLTNYTIDRIKQIADRKSNTVSKPSTTGFKEFARRRLSLQDAVSEIQKNITNKEFQTKEYLGEIDGKGKLYICKVYRMLCKNSKTSEFRLGINDLKAVSNLLNKISENLTSKELLNYVDSFKNLCSEKSINSTEPFLGRFKKVVTEDNMDYSPSSGEKGILMLQKQLRGDYTAIFLDEPELGMGNSYINNIICPQIMELAKENKTIVIATHNANIAVRTLPYTSFFRTHENGIYKTYVGNPFNDILINIEDGNDRKSWSEESMKTLEGGPDAFYERKYIYESNN